MGIEDRLQLRCSRQRILDLDHQSPIMLVVELQDDRPARIVNIVEDGALGLIVRAGSDHSRNLCAWHPKTVPPTGRCVGINPNRTDVRDRNVELTPERPQLVPAFDINVNVITNDGNANHSREPILGDKSCSVRRQQQIAR